MFDDDQQEQDIIPELHIKVKNKDGKFEDRTLKNVGQAEYIDILAQTKKGNVSVLDKDKKEFISANAEIKPEPKNYNRIPQVDFLDKLFGTNDSLARGVGAASSLVGTGLNPMNLALGVPGAMANLKNPPRTFSDAMYNVAVPRAMGQVGKALPQTGSIPLQGFIESLMAGGGGLTEQAVRDETNRALDPKASMQDPRAYLQNPEQWLGLLATMGLGGAGGAMGAMASRNRPKMNAEFTQEVTGQPAKPWDYTEQAKNYGPPSSLQVPVNQERNFQANTAQELNVNKQSQSVSQSEIARIQGQKALEEKAKRQTELNLQNSKAENREQIGALKLQRNKANNPDLAEAHSALEEADYRYREAKKNKMSPDVIEHYRDQREAAIQYKDNVKSKIEDDIIARAHEMKKFPETKAMHDARQQLAGHDKALQDLNHDITVKSDEIAELQRQFQEAKVKSNTGRYDGRVKAILDSGSNLEETAKGLLNANEAEIQHFFTVMDKQHPKLADQMRKDVVKQMANASFDPQTGYHSDFERNFNSANSQFPNIRARLSAVYGNSDKADNVVKMMEALNHAAETRKKFNGVKDFATTASAGSIIWQLASPASTAT